MSQARKPRETEPAEEIEAGEATGEHGGLDESQDAPASTATGLQLDESEDEAGPPQEQPLPDGHYKDDQYPIDQAVTHSMTLIGHHSWVAKAALAQTEIGDYATVEDLQAAVDKFLAHPVDGEPVGDAS
jgi:hypothetical protein